MGMITRVIGKVKEGVETARRTIGKFVQHAGHTVIGKIEQGYDYLKKHHPVTLGAAERIAEALHPDHVKSAREAWYAAKGLVKAQAYNE